METQETHQETMSDEALLSPPAGWPACFQQSVPLKRFVSKVLKGKRCRLTDRPPADVRAEAARCPEEGELRDAQRVSTQLGWPIVRGYALYERSAAPGVYVAKPHAWHTHPTRGMWVDLSPRRQPQLVLVEAPIPPGSSANAIWSDEPAVATRSGATVDVSDGSHAVANASASPTAAAAASPAVLPDAASCAAPSTAPPADLSAAPPAAPAATEAGTMALRPPDILLRQRARDHEGHGVSLRPSAEEVRPQYTHIPYMTCMNMNMVVDVDMDMNMSPDAPCASLDEAPSADCDPIAPTRPALIATRLRAPVSRTGLRAGMARQIHECQALTRCRAADGVV